MVKYSLSDLFGSLSDDTRRDILQRLLRGEQTISQLAEAYRMSLPGVSKHLKVLELAGLVVKEKRGRQWFVRLSPAALKGATDHLLYYETTLHNRLGSFAAYLRPEPKPAAASTVPVVAEPQTIVVTEILDVDPAAAWRAYTNPADIKQWWSLPGAQLVNVENDVRVGGGWRFTVRDAQGRDYIVSGTYSVVDYPHRLEYTDGIGDISRSRPEAQVTLTFEPLPDGQTLLTKTSLATPAVHQLNAVWLQTIGGS